MNRAPLLLMMVGVYCLLFPFCGLVLDHHFVERQPDHMHLYLERVTTNHTHPYEVSHTHTNEGGNTSLQGLFKGEPAPDGIVYLPSPDAVSQSLAQLAASPIHLSLDFPSLDEASHTFSIPADDTDWQDPYLTLPEKPPQV